MTMIWWIGLTATSCISDAVSTSPNDILTFSRDTVSFDTVFTDLGTPTARLIVANRAKKESSFPRYVSGIRIPTSAST